MTQDEINEALLDAARSGSAGQIREMVALGADIETRSASYSGATALGIAAWAGSTEALQALIEAGADVNARDRDGRTPVLRALRSREYHLAYDLIRAGADAEIADQNGETAYAYAKRENLDVFCGLCREAGKDKNPDEVVFESRVNFQTLQEIFNFVRGDRLSLILNDKGEIAAMSRESFSAIDDKHMLLRAFSVYKDRGGLAAEDIIYGQDSKNAGLVIRKPSRHQR